MRESVLSLARANEIPTDHVEWFDASKQTTRISANVSGLGGVARISLNDNLLDKTSLPEIRAVLGHEMGHYVLNHPFKLAVYFTLLFGIAFAVVAWAFELRAGAAGAPHSPCAAAPIPAALPLLVAIFSLVWFLLTPFTNSRGPQRRSRGRRLRTQRRARAGGLRHGRDAPVDLSQAAPGCVRGIHLLRPSRAATTACTAR